jgi:CubicO group peptidase (beta-lactamase class C family)
MLFRFTLAWALFSAPIFAADQFEAVRDFIRTRMSERQVPSITVAVARDGKILWEEGFGWADRENRVLANEHTMYSLASTTKPFTATALMTLVEKKRIDLDRPVNQYLGNAKVRARVGNADDATVRRVANHSAGLPVHGQYFVSDEPFRPPSMDETILRYGNLVTIPGEKFEYSNLGYGILGYIISRVSEQSYEDYMRQAVFLKLGLTHTSVGIGPGLEKFAAVRYNTDGLPLPFYDVDHRGGAAIYSSAHDLIRFAMFHLKAHLPDQVPILSDASIEEMQRPTVTTGPSIYYGIGWFINDLVGYRTVNHPGSLWGGLAMLRLVPSERTAVVVLCNSRRQSELPQEVVDKILATLLPKYKLPPPSSPSQAVRFQPPPTLVGTWTGALSTYKADIPLVLNVLASGEVQVRLGNQLQTLLNDVTWENDTLSGLMNGDIAPEDSNRRGDFWRLKLKLKLRTNLLNGPAEAQSIIRLRPDTVAQWVELKKN